MIKKIKNIKNLAVFQNFEWDKPVTDKDNNICEFKSVNILYGRNYSGKTTLSRIFRAMETGELSDKYGNPDFCISIQNEDDVTQNNLKDHSEKIRVFNEDFVKDNLRFISDPDASIEPFAVLGTDNNVVEKEIATLKADLGSKEEGKETGLYADSKKIGAEFQTASTSYQTAQQNLNNQLREKATNRITGIRYQSEQFGDQNYNIQKLSDDIQKVLKNNFEIITNEKQTKLNALLEEKPLSSIPSHPKINPEFADFSEQTKQLVEKEIGVSNKIQELVKDAILSKWVKEGATLHKDKRKTCAFCNNTIQENRWSELGKHFDEESENLEKELDNLIAKIENEKTGIQGGFKANKDRFYSKSHSEFDTLSEKYTEEFGKYNNSLDELNSQLEHRKNNLISPQEFKQPDNYEQELIKIWGNFERICVDSNEFTTSLSQNQTKAKESLRLREVSDFVTTIKYSDQLKTITDLRKNNEEKNAEKTKLTEEIDKKTNSIGEKKKLLKDESKGADKVNEYLNNFFGHKFLSLKAVEFQDEDDTTKKFKFEIMRNEGKAYNLSEGENNLIAFCYFMAKLEDIDTKDTKPIIWIDDPVSSLDGNHIFFIYSLIEAKIIGEENFKQLFVSTHSLEFLKYLKRFNSNNSSKSYFIVTRFEESSSIELMPKYLKEYITEFNYLFQQIYNCSLIDVVNDPNHSTCYNFGNNARKFLEIFLYYKYPDSSKPIEKLTKFFGEREIPVIITDRINNEYSHLSGVLERGATPVVVPEMQSTAKMILERMEQTDKEQYEALLRSIETEQL